MTEMLAGEFHSFRITDGKMEALNKWRVTAREPGIGKRVAKALGGVCTSRSIGGDEYWETLTTSARLEIIVRGVEGHGILFRITRATDIGTFVLRVFPWSCTEIFHGVEPPQNTDLPGVLAIEQVEFQTRNGMVLHYLIPRVHLLEV